MTTEFRLRSATPADQTAVSAVLEASYTKAFTGHYQDRVLAAALPLMTRANPRLLASGTYHVAETARGRLVGCGGWSLDRPGSGEVVEGLAHVRHFGTDPAWMRRGVGRALFALCAVEAAERGIGRFECYSSLVAEDFYRALGFRRVRTTDIQLSPGIMLGGVVMELEMA